MAPEGADHDWASAQSLWAGETLNSVKGQPFKNKRVFEEENDSTTEVTEVYYDHDYYCMKT